MRAEADDRGCALALVGVACMVAACAHDAAAPDGALPDVAAPARSTTRVAEANFELALSAPSVVRVGAAAAASLSIEGRGEYHVNEEYPLRVRLLSTPDIALARTELSGADAAELGAQRARFELPFTCRAPGAHRIEVALEFALCTETTCIPENRTVALDLQASP